MGSPAPEKDRQGNEVQHRRVIRKAFYLSQNEVSKAEWRAIAGRLAASLAGSSESGELPVDGVSWREIHEDFLATSRGFFRLSSEAEWEYACRAGTTTAYSFGDTITSEQACFRAKAPVACGSLPANPWGFHEMHGNVWEWVEDLYDEYPMEGGTEEPSRTAMDGSRVLRGGGWGINASNCRAAYRIIADPVRTSGFFGFRVARTPD